MNAATPYTPSNSLFDRVRRRVAYEWPVARTNVHQDGGVISFAFDDFPKTAGEAGAAALEKHGARGTFYTSFRLSKVDNHQGLHFDLDDVQRLSGAGHEIGCHSYSHMDFARASAADIKRDLGANAAALAQAGLTQPLKSFAYPYGELTVSAKRLLAGRFTSARGVRAGINHGAVDMTSLLSTPIEHWRDDMESVAKSWIDATVKKGGWLIFYTHDIRENPSDYGATPSMLENIVGAATTSGAKVMTVDQAADLFAKQPVRNVQ